MERIRYARNGDVHLAYQVVGEGELDIVCVPGWFSDVETAWDVPGLGWFLQHLSEIGRLVLFDKRGTGQSDRIDGRFPSFEERVGDVLAVMDAAGSEQAVLVGVSEGGTQALLTAARHPHRVRAVVAISAWVRLVATPEEPGFGITRQELETFVTRARDHWGTGRDVGVIAPSRRDDPLFVERWTTLERRAASPGTVEAYGEALGDLDITDDLPHVRAPTLLLHAVGDRMVPVDQSRRLARSLPHATLVELPGDDHLPFFTAPELLWEAIERHLLGHVRAVSADRRFAVVLFTDIVGSTDRAASVGDRSWASLLDAYERLAGRAVVAQGGRVVTSTGDGTLAVFPEPEAAVLCATRLHAEVSQLGVQLRAGLHCGQVELRGDDVGGIAVHIAARVASAADARSTWVSSTLRDVLMGSGFAFRSCGTRELRGVPGVWELFALQR